MTGGRREESNPQNRRKPQPSTQITPLLSRLQSEPWAESSCLDIETTERDKNGTANNNKVRLERPRNTISTYTHFPSK